MGKLEDAQVTIRECYKRLQVMEMMIARYKRPRLVVAADSQIDLSAAQKTKLFDKWDTLLQELKDKVAELPSAPGGA